MADSTPGPWREQRADAVAAQEGGWREGSGIYAENAAAGSRMPAVAYGRNVEETHANARLIAAAPAMLDALEDFVADHDADRRSLARDAGMNNPDAETCDCGLCQTASAAIAQATGIGQNVDVRA